jgi:hypothetical protein
MSDPAMRPPVKALVVGVDEMLQRGYDFGRVEKSLLSFRKWTALESQKSAGTVEPMRGCV